MCVCVLTMFWPPKIVWLRRTRRPIQAQRSLTKLFCRPMKSINGAKQELQKRSKKMKKIGPFKRNMFFFQLKMVKTCQNHGFLVSPGSQHRHRWGPQGWLNAFGVALGVLGASLDAVAPLGFGGVFLKGLIFEQCPVDPGGERRTN